WVSKSSTVSIPRRRSASRRGREIQLTSSSGCEIAMLACRLGNAGDVRSAIGDSSDDVAPFTVYRLPVTRNVRPLAPLQSAFQPEFRHHIHPPQFGTRCPTAAAETQLPPRQNKRRADVDRPGATER